MAKWEGVKSTLEMRVEVHPTAVPTPLGLMVRKIDSSEVVGWFNVNDVRAALEAWDKCVAEYENRE